MDQWGHLFMGALLLLCVFKVTLKLKNFIVISSSFEIKKTKMCEIIEEYKKTNSWTSMGDLWSSWRADITWELVEWYFKIKFVRVILIT